MNSSRQGWLLETSFHNYTFSGEIPLLRSWLLHECVAPQYAICFDVFIKKFQLLTRENYLLSSILKTLWYVSVLEDELTLQTVVKPYTLQELQT